MATLPLVLIGLATVYVGCAGGTLLWLAEEAHREHRRLDLLVDGLIAATWFAFVGVRIHDHLLRWRSNRAHRKETSC